MGRLAHAPLVPPIQVTRTSCPRRRSRSARRPARMPRPRPPLVAAQNHELLAARRVPYPHRVVSGPADDPLAIRRERDGRTSPVWPLRTEAPRRSPRSTGAPCRRRTAHDPSAIWREGYGVDRLIVAHAGNERSLPRAASHTRTFASADPLTMRAPSGEKRGGRESTPMAAKDQEFLAARCVPNPHCAVLRSAHDPIAIGRERRWH